MGTLFWLPLTLAILCFSISSVFGKEKESSKVEEGIVLGANRSDADHYGLRRSFRCPGKGNYAVRAAGNCAKYFDCKKKGRRPIALKQCPKPDQNFNRLSRSCEKAEFVKCKWCRKEGLHADRTSDKHFISCEPGLIAARYKCNKGTYDPVWRKCHKTVNPIFKIEDDADEDEPADIVKFMQDWMEDEEEDQPAKKKHKKKSKDSDEDNDDDDDSDKKDKKKGKGRGFLNLDLNLLSGLIPPMPMMPPMGGAPYPLPLPPPPAAAQDKSKHNSIEVSDSSEERKRKQGPLDEDDESGSEEESKEKKTKTKKSKD